MTTDQTPALFPPTEREATLAQVRRAMTVEMNRLCRATRESYECAAEEPGECDACPRHALPHIAGVLDELARGWK